MLLLAEQKVLLFTFIHVIRTVKAIAIFASGEGTNARVIIEHFKNHPDIRVALVLTNNPSAGVIKLAQSNKIISAIVSKHFFQQQQSIESILNALNIELIVLAGFLQLVPAYLIQKFPNRIINIHPALLPKFGGKGMYGKKVHEAVLAANESETGITVHYVNEVYDEGEIILQAKTPVTLQDTPSSLAEKVQQLEHKFYVKAITQVLG